MPLFANQQSSLKSAQEGYYDLLENSGLIYEPLNITYGALIDKLRARSRSIHSLFD